MSAPKYDIAIGSETEGRSWIGRSNAPRQGGVAVNDGMIRLLCGTIHDANPRYWQEGESPPGMLYTWILDMPWAPGQPVRRPVMAIGVPLPGNLVANVAQKVEFHEIIKVGDLLTIVETLESISTEKSTPLGRGHFVVTKADVTREDGMLVATVTNTMFRYRTT